MGQTSGLNYIDITVAIPTYKRDFYLDKLLSTIPADVKISVSDNGAFVHSDLKSKYPNASFISHPTIIDIFENWNCAAKNTLTEWVVIPSDDDLFDVNAFETIKRCTSKHTDADVLIFGHDVIDENDNVTQGWCPSEERVFDSPFGYEIFKYGVDARMPAIVFKREKLEKLGFFDSAYKLTASDSDLIQRVLLTGKSVFIPAVIGSYRIWKGNLTSQKVASIQWLSEIDYWQNKIRSIAAVCYKNISAKPNFNMIADEVYAQNLLTGISNLKSKSGFLTTFSFLKSVRFPWKARTITKLRIIKALID